MLRTVVCASAALAFVGTLAFAGQISDLNNTFRITAPDDWRVERPNIPTVGVFLVSPQAADTGGNCNVVIVPDETTKTLSQKEVEDMLAKEVSEEWWRQAIMGARGIKSTKIEKWGDKKHKGRKAFYVKATSDFERDGQTRSLTQVLDLHVIPGRNYAVTCTARADAFAKEEGAFTKIMASFEVIPDMTVASAQKGAPSPAAVLTQGPAVARALAAKASDALSEGAARAQTK